MQCILPECDSAAPAKNATPWRYFIVVSQMSRLAESCCQGNVHIASSCFLAFLIPRMPCGCIGPRNVGNR